MQSFPVLLRHLSTASRTDLVNRLHRQSRTRGTLENCIILGNFARKHLDELPYHSLVEYSDMLSENDLDIFGWINGSQSVPEKYASSHAFGLVCSYYQGMRQSLPSTEASAKR